MSRQEATNVFNDGLIMDLNPLTTPDNVLTDCLNGTFITYNGNEFVLQNDQGNYNLENAKLKPDFIPVGIREYADILYIVSYNPITKETEIGSYPSPRTIFTTKDKQQSVQFTPIIPDENGETDYEKLTQKAKLQLYALSNDMENFKLNPGDLFTVLVDKSDVFPYQTIQFAILNDDKNLIPIDIPEDEGYIWPYGTQVDDKDFKPVFWKLPGWLTGKYRLAVIDQFYLNVREIVMPEFTDQEDFTIETISLNSQISISDDLFIKNSETINDLKIEYKCWAVDSRNQTIEVPIEIISSDLNGNKSNFLRTHNYNDLSTIYFHNLSFSAKERNRFETIFVEAVPVLINKGNTVYYNQFRTTQSFNLATINDAKDITAADLIYQYITDNDSLTLTFNISGPFVNNSSISVNLELYSLNDATINNIKSKLVYNEKLTEVNFFGQNMVDIKFQNYYPYIENFENENMYILSIVFNQNDSILKRVNKLLISSETFNIHYNNYSNFDDINLEEWLYRYGEYMQRMDFDNVITNNTKSIDNWEPATKQWVNNIKITPSKTAAPTMTFTPPNNDYNWYSDSFTIPSAPSYFYGSKYDTKITLTPNDTQIKGLLWKGVDSNNTLKYTISDFEGDRPQSSIVLDKDLSRPFDINFISKFGGVVNCWYERLSTTTATQIPRYDKIWPFELLQNVDTNGVKMTAINMNRFTSSNRNRRFQVRVGRLNGASYTLNTNNIVGFEIRNNDWNANPNTGDFLPMRNNITSSDAYFSLVVVGFFNGEHNNLRIENPYIGNTGDNRWGPYAMFKGADDLLYTIPFYDANGTTPIGKMKPNNAGWTGGIVTDSVSKAVKQFSNAFFYATNINPNIRGFFLYPSSNTSLITSNVIKNFIANLNINDIIYLNRSLINNNEGLYQLIQSIENSLLTDTNVFDRISSNNLKYSQRDDSKLNITINFNYILDNIESLSTTSIQTQLDTLSTYINTIAVTRANDEFTRSQSDPVIEGGNKAGFYINNNIALESWEILAYQSFYKLLTMDLPNKRARISRNTHLTNNFFNYNATWNSNSQRIRFAYCPPNNQDVYIPYRETSD